MLLIPNSQQGNNIFDQFSLNLISHSLPPHHSLHSLIFLGKIGFYEHYSRLEGDPRNPRVQNGHFGAEDVKKDEVKVEVEDNRVLQISEEKNVEKEDKHDKWHRVRQVLERFQLPENAKVDQIKAAMENRVLSVIVPKTDVKKPDVKAVEING
ncbi:hypothetical protein DVH24_032983 [Malus domestica]|uniref:SHSP domain-containing protein n=1 Tax=Malus domestica TaxID=3750 RepID=A0A498INH4_MALDO|nr:hypothetical protein DVH24_032983 [Malus domestica]